MALLRIMTHNYHLCIVQSYTTRLFNSNQYLSVGVSLGTFSHIKDNQSQKPGCSAFDLWNKFRNGVKTLARGEQRIRGPGNYNMKCGDA